VTPAICGAYRGGGRFRRDQAVALRELGGGGDGAAGGLLDAGGVKIEEDERGHEITLASLRSLSRRVATSATLMPALRWRLGDLDGREARAGSTPDRRADGVDGFLRPS